MRISPATRLTRGPAKNGVIDYPTSDGKALAKAQVHVDLIVDVLATLRHAFRRRRRVLVVGNIFLYYEEDSPQERRSPDVMVVKGVEAARNRLYFKTWEEKAVPAFIMEMTSKSTAQEDLVGKKEVYQKLRVPEYFLFDPLGEYLPEPFVAFRMNRGEYQTVKAHKKGGFVSLELGIRFVPDGTRLHLFDQRTGEKLLAPEEAYAELDQSRKQLEEYERKIKDLEEELARRKGR